MQILYSDILPIKTEQHQKTIAECFSELALKADRIEIAVGYVSRNSLDEIESIVERVGIKKIVINIGMYYVEGMPENSYHTALKLNQKWKESGIGEIRIVRAFKYHGKIYCFIKNNIPFAVIMGSANMGVIKPDANNLRQYEVASITEDNHECNEFLTLVEKFKEPRVSANISEISDMKLIREQNVSLNGIELVSQVPPEGVKLYYQHKTDISFTLPIKVPAFSERFSDDSKHYTKSNINVCYASPRSKRKSRDWYEVQMTVSKDITRLTGYPEKNKPFFVITDDGYWFKAHTTSDGNKQFSAVGDELIMGRWIKGRLAASGLVTPVNNTQLDKNRMGMITKEILNAYGCNALVITKTDQKANDTDGSILEVWTLSFENIEE